MAKRPQRAVRYEIQRILPRHEKIIQLALAGHKNSTIASTLGMSITGISMILQSPIVQGELKRRRESSQEGELLRLDADATRGKALSILSQASESAAETVVALMGSTTENMQLKSAIAVLDRVFPKDNGKGNAGTVINVELSGDQAQLLVLAMKESDNGQNNQQPADSPSTNTAEGEQDSVHEGAEASTCVE